MLVASLALLLAAQPGASGLKTCPDGSVLRQDDQCAPAIDHRGQYAVIPETMTKTVEWQCGARTAKAQVRTAEQPFTNEKGEPVAKYLFKTELVELSVDGAPASVELQARVRSDLAPLNSVIQLYGRCFDDVPELNIFGYSLTAPRWRRSQIELK